MLFGIASNYAGGKWLPGGDAAPRDPHAGFGDVKPASFANDDECTYIFVI